MTLTGGDKVTIDTKRWIFLENLLWEVEALAKEWDAQHVPEYLTPQQYANRLRSILEAKP